jgi:hypothetical protein
MKILLICAFLLVGCASTPPDPRLVQPLNYQAGRSFRYGDDDKTEQD